MPRRAVTGAGSTYSCPPLIQRASRRGTSTEGTCKHGQAITTEAKKNRAKEHGYKDCCFDVQERSFVCAHVGVCVCVWA